MLLQAEERLRRPLPQAPVVEPKSTDEGSGPGRPRIPRPDTRQLLERMKRVNPNMARKYRQRSGE